MFRIDLWALFIAALVSAGFFYLWRKKQSDVPPHISYSRLANFSSEVHGGRNRFYRYEKILYFLSLIFFLGAFLDPRWTASPQERKAGPLFTEGVALYFILDVSGSMEGRVLDTREGREEAFPTKLELLKDVTGQFIQRRPQDLIGLVSFARGAWVLSPLTLSRDILKQKLAGLNVVKERAYDGTAIGYAIYKTASVIAASKKFSEKEEGYDIKGSAMIIVTDGFQSPHPGDKGKRLRTIEIEEAAGYAKEQGVRLYIITIDPRINDPEFLPIQELMKKSAEMTGGEFFYAGDAQKLEEIYGSIDELEESKLKVAAYPETIRTASLYPLLIALGLISLSGAIVLETLVVRKVP